MNKIESELEAVKFTVIELKRKQKETKDQELYNKIQKEIDEFEKYRLELLDKTKALPKQELELDYDNVDKKILEYKVNNEVLEELAMLEHEQWCDWSKSISVELKETLTLLETILNGDVDETILKENIEKLNNRLNRWETLWIPYEDLSEEMKDSDRDYAERVLSRLYFKYNIKI